MKLRRIARSPYVDIIEFSKRIDPRLNPSSPYYDDEYHRKVMNEWTSIKLVEKQPQSLWQKIKEWLLNY